MHRYLRILYSMPVIKFGTRAISGRYIMDKNLKAKGAKIKVWKKYFLVYTLKK
jgi:hypothetical protein